MLRPEIFPYYDTNEQRLLLPLVANTEIMASKAVEHAFQRHPRPQGVPTKVALLERAKHNEKKSTARGRQYHESPWKSLVKQGDLTQGLRVWSICTQHGELRLVKETTIESGHQEFEKLSKLSDHPHVSTIKQVFETDTSWFFMFEYSRITLEEILNVHTPLEENHIRVIASSVSLSNPVTSHAKCWRFFLQSNTSLPRESCIRPSLLARYGSAVMVGLFSVCP
jgi:serine/threonine protein kinase